MDDSPPLPYCTNCGSLLVEQETEEQEPFWVCPSCGPEVDDGNAADLQEFF